MAVYDYSTTFYFQLANTVKNIWANKHFKGHI